MTITQLKYIIAVDKYKSFVAASTQCFVTQSTLSMQIKKLENLLGVILFDRSKKPVKPTLIGKIVIQQAKIGLSELARIPEIIQIEAEEMKGTLRIGIIPTLSPYLLPAFTISFIKKYPNIQLIFHELLSEEIVYKLYDNKIDIGILVTPLDNSNLHEITLFYEAFVGYFANNHSLLQTEFIDFHDLDIDQMWLMKEGHCFRNQIINICKDASMKNNKNNLLLENGSLESLRRIVEEGYGYTLLPELATLDFSKQQQQLVRYFKKPEPVREVSLVIHRNFLKKQMLEALKDTILENIPEQIRNRTQGEIITWK